MTQPTFAALRAALGLPYEYDPYHKALKRAEEEATATSEAAMTWLFAAITEGGALACSELLFWVGQAHAARVRLEEMRRRKRST